MGRLLPVGSDENIHLPSAGEDGPQAGVGTGSTASDVRFDNFEFLRHRAGCAFCAVFSSGCPCLDGLVPQAWAVTFNGIGASNGDVGPPINCDILVPHLNGIPFILETPNPSNPNCGWLEEYVLGNRIVTIGLEYNDALPENMWCYIRNPAAGAATSNIAFFGRVQDSGDSCIDESGYDLSPLSFSRCDLTNASCIAIPLL